MKLQKLKRLSMIIGFNNPITNSVNNNTPEVIQEELKKLNIDGYSLNNGVGYWKSEKENNITLTVINNFTSNTNFMALIDGLYINLKKALQQEEITVIIDEVITNL